jgi:hypothetical protein
MTYDPNSTDSMFSKVLSRLDEQDKVLAEIRTAVNLTNGRVRTLETWRAVIKGKVTLIAGGISSAVAALAWLADYLRS